MTTEDDFLDSSDIFRESPCRGIGGNVAKNLSDIFCGSFSLFFVLHFFAISSICMHSHSQHSQTKLSPHHTEVIQSYHIQTIIPKSHGYHSILETYVNGKIFETFADTKIPSGFSILDIGASSGGSFQIFSARHTRIRWEVRLGFEKKKGRRRATEREREKKCGRYDDDARACGVCAFCFAFKSPG
jgi:hypothetical protein